LATVVKSSTGGSPTVLSRYAYTYDPAGNRTTEQIGDAALLSTHDGLNRVFQQQPGGVLRFAGTVDEPATVTIQGGPARVAATNMFSGTAATAVGSNTVTIQATDSSGNTTSVQYQVTVSGTGRTLTYDANGNFTNDGTRTFEWDARNQLVAVTVGTHRSEFTYDGRQRRVRIVEKESNVVEADTRLLWCDGGICEERASDGVAVTRRIFAGGEQVAGTTRFFAGDHLSSVTDVTDDTGTLLGRYGFDAWGRRTLLAGIDVTSVGFTGHQWHATGGLSLTWYRGYDAELGRWLSPDPLGTVDGLNVYLYVQNNGMNRIDPLGLAGMGFPGLYSSVYCATMVRDKVVHAVGPTAPDRDKYVHCLISCYMTVTCGTATAAAAGIGKEAEDLVGPGDPDWEDLEADYRGIRCGREFRKRRKGSCEQAVASTTRHSRNDDRVLRGEFGV
jgi:RHS repeat-associated protein